MTSPLVGSGLPAMFTKWMGGESRAKSTSVTEAAARSNDVVSLSPESLAVQESIAQNQQAAVSVLGDTDQLDEQTLAALAALVRKDHGIKSIIG